MATTPIQDGSSHLHNGYNTPLQLDVVMQASELLEQLCAARQSTEQRLAEAGRIDPLKKVTGRSSLDNAIERTERLLQEMQALSSSGENAEPLHGTIVEIERDACHSTLSNTGNGAQKEAWRRTPTPALALVR